MTRVKQTDYRSSGHPYAEQLEYLRSRVLKGLDEGLGSPESVIITDLPDHPNVGDSAIFLGELAWARARGIRVAAAYSKDTFTSRGARRHAAHGATVVIHGGGNLGGLYRHHHQARLAVLETLRHAVLVQAPQSYAHVSNGIDEQLDRALTSGARRTVMLRDQASYLAWRDRAPAVRKMMVPDAVHCLGPLALQPATQRVVVLARTDTEAIKRTAVGVDWLCLTPDPLKHRIRRHAAATSEGLARVLNPSVSEWQNLAHARFLPGLALLAAGDTIVTDRLHAMLLGVHLGRKLIVVDTSNRKLRAYYETWLIDLGLDIRWAETMTMAMEMADVA
jgi:exopolysaccharide biosynthesis predicted pyruvyltransferase EpsI